MKFTCTKENINKVLNLVSPLASKQGHLPILMNIMIVANESKVDMIATNLEIAVRASLRAKVDQVGSFTVPAKTIADYINLLSDSQVEISLEGNELIVTSGNSSTKIKGMPSDEFPVVPEVEDSNVYTLSVDDFKNAMTKTVIASAKNEIRPELSGVYMGFFKSRYKGLILAATDSYRLAESKINIEQGENEMELIVPSRTVYDMIRLLSLSKDGEKETKVRIWVSNNQIALRYDDFEMTSRLVDGKYPDYAQIIPGEFKSTATFPTDVMIKKIKAAGLFTATGVNAVSFDFNVENKTVSVSSTNTQTGQHNSEIDADVSGEENSILLNHRYVLDGLQHIGNEVDFKVNGSDAPCMLQEKGNDKYIYIVMPIRQ
jgi:DNA polymerase-3 subunit beta